MASQAMEATPAALQPWRGNDQREFNFVSYHSKLPALSPRSRPSHVSPRQQPKRAEVEVHHRQAHVSREPGREHNADGPASPRSPTLAEAARSGGDGTKGRSSGSPKGLVKGYSSASATSSASAVAPEYEHSLLASDGESEAYLEHGFASIEEWQACVKRRRGELELLQQENRRREDALQAQQKKDALLRNAVLDAHGKNHFVLADEAAKGLLRGARQRFGE